MLGQSGTDIAQVVGTSAGGIIAAAISKGMGMEETERVSSYAPAARCPVLTRAMLLRGALVLTWAMLLRDARVLTWALLLQDIQHSCKEGLQRGHAWYRGGIAL